MPRRASGWLLNAQRYTQGPTLNFDRNICSTVVLYETMNDDRFECKVHLPQGMSALFKITWGLGMAQIAHTGNQCRQCTNYYWWYMPAAMTNIHLLEGKPQKLASCL